MEDKTPTIDEWEWDEGNLWKAEDHGYTPRTVVEVASGEPRFRPNTGEGRSATHQMVGPASSGRRWTFCILQVREGLWRTITGWPSTKTEGAWYDQEERNDEQGE